MRKLVTIVCMLVLNAQDRAVVREEFYSNGNLKLQFISVGHKLVEATYFFENGAVYEMGYYLNERLTGNWLTFDVNSNLQTSAYFADNKRIGVWNLYENGVLYKQVLYTSSVLVEL